jgi:hypothetical protein
VIFAEGAVFGVDGLGSEIGFPPMPLRFEMLREGEYFESTFDSVSN